jgi:hypothetical protein
VGASVAPQAARRTLTTCLTVRLTKGPRSVRGCGTHTVRGELCRQIADKLSEALSPSLATGPLTCGFLVAGGARRSAIVLLTVAAPPRRLAPARASATRCSWSDRSPSTGHGSVPSSRRHAGRRQRDVAQPAAQTLRDPSRLEASAPRNAKSAGRRGRSLAVAAHAHHGDRPRPVARVAGVMGPTAPRRRNAPSGPSGSSPACRRR